MVVFYFSPSFYNYYLEFFRKEDLSCSSNYLFVNLNQYGLRNISFSNAIIIYFVAHIILALAIGLRMVFRSQDLGTGCAHCSRVVTTSRACQWTELGHICMYIT